MASGESSVELGAVGSLHAEYVFSVFKMRLNKSTDTRIQNGGEMRIHTYLLLLTY